MKKYEVISLTKDLLKIVPDIRQQIKLIDAALKIDTYDVDTIDKLKKKRCRLHSRLSGVIEAIGTLDDENQRIICYRYFDKLACTVIAQRLGLSNKTIFRRIDKNVLDIGRVIFGFENEFWNEVLCVPSLYNIPRL